MINELKHSLLVLLGISLLVSSCDSGNCDRDFYIRVSGLSMLEKAELTDCFDNLEWMTMALFQLSEDQLEELLESGDFQPVRASLNQIQTPIRRINKIFEQIDQLSQYRPKNLEDVSCILTLKEDSRQLVVSVTYADWSGD